MTGVFQIDVDAAARLGQSRARQSDEQRRAEKCFVQFHKIELLVLESRQQRWIPVGFLAEQRRLAVYRGPSQVYWKRSETESMRPRAACQAAQRPNRTTEFSARRQPTVPAPDTIQADAQGYGNRPRWRASDTSNYNAGSQIDRRYA